MADANLALSVGTTSAVVYGVQGDPNTGLNIDTADSVALVAGGIETVKGTATTLVMKAGATTVVSLVAGNYIKKVVKVALAALDTAGGVLAWANPESGAIAVTEIILDVTTQSTGACTLDVGTTAVSAATSSDNLIDGLSVAAAGMFTNTVSPGTNGKAAQRLASGKWVTASMASGAAAGLVGSAYITYLVL